MASSTSLAIRRLLSSSSVIPRSVVRPAASLRLLNTNAARKEADDRNHRSNQTVSSRRRGGFFSAMFDPSKPSRILCGELINYMEQLGQSRGWDVKEKDNALHLRIDMPGLSREDVKLALEEDNTLVIKGEVDEEEDRRKFLSKIGLPERVYKTDEIKAEMKNGVLKVVVPKMKEEEHYNIVRHIQID